MSERRNFKFGLWAWCCSLKLAIVLASLVTLLTIYGSLVMHGHPELFGNLDRIALRTWWAGLPAGSMSRTWWLPFTGLLLVGLGLNTLCCLIDWLLRLRSRWRKVGEYLIHFGFILLVSAFAWGSYAGSRSDGVRIFLHEPFAIPGMPGHRLIVDQVAPVLGPQGRPLDMRNQLRLVRGDEQLAAAEISINRPLLYRDLVVVPVSFGQQAQGFECYLPGVGNLAMIPGQTFELPQGKTLRVLDFVADAGQTAAGQVIRRGSRLQNPALYLELSLPGRPAWQGWYFLRDQLPYPLLAGGVRFWPVKPLLRDFTVLTVNVDPGARLALAAGLAILVGTLLALVSFYRKRRFRDRPEV